MDRKRKALSIRMLQLFKKMLMKELIGWKEIEGKVILCVVNISINNKIKETNYSNFIKN
jgi:hypothetical protein